MDVCTRVLLTTIRRYRSDASYNDFFDPPLRVKPSSQATPKPGKVRFHDEVKVKKIKARGRNLPLNADVVEDEEEEEDESGESEESDGETPGYHDMDMEDMEDTDGEHGEDAALDDDSDTDHGGRGDMERIRTDLFADEDENEEDGKPFMTYTRFL